MLIGVPGDHRGDGFERDVEFVGDDLAIGGEGCALAEVGFAGTNQDGVVGMNFDQGIKLSRIERILQGRAGNFRALKL